MNSAATNKKHCKHCRLYRAFYDRGLFGFFREKKGICRHKRKIVGEAETCENFSRRPYRDVSVTIGQLDLAIANAKALEEIFSESEP